MLPRTVVLGMSPASECQKAIIQLPGKVHGVWLIHAGHPIMCPWLEVGVFLDKWHPPHQEQLYQGHKQGVSAG